MNATQALAKAKKLLGSKAVIEVNNRIPVGEARLAEVARRKELSDDLKRLQEARDARRAAVLKADAEYQRLRGECEATEKQRDSLVAEYHYRVRVKVDKGWCYHVEAEGDNFDEAIAALEAKKGGAA